MTLHDWICTGLSIAFLGTIVAFTVQVYQWRQEIKKWSDQ